MLCAGGADPVSVYAGNGYDAVQLLHAVSADSVPGNDVWGKFCGSVECQSFQSVLSEQSYHCGNSHGGNHAGVLCRGICLCADEISRQGCPVLSVPVFHDGADGNKPDPAVPADEGYEAGGQLSGAASHLHRNRCPPEYILFTELFPGAAQRAGGGRDHRRRKPLADLLENGSAAVQAGAWHLCHSGLFQYF